MEAWPLLCNLCLSRHSLLMSPNCMWRMCTNDRGQSSNQSSPPFKPSVSVSLLHVCVYWHHNCLSKHIGYDNNNTDAVHFWTVSTVIGWLLLLWAEEDAEEWWKLQRMWQLLFSASLVFFKTPDIHSSWLTVQVICVLWKIQKSKIIHLDSWTQGGFVRR